ncbi:MAG: hypothetical protein KY461_12885 [Actinobacteria bacterium]|nr:hypothetical protein [Actinomycetota bacterium]
MAGERELRFADGSPVRAASAVARLGAGWLVAQDDATAGAWLAGRDAVSAQRVRLLPPVDGHDVFSEAGGTKRSKPDLEAAVELPASLGGGVLLLGSGSLPNRRRAVLVTERTAGVDVLVADLGPLYERVTTVLGLAPADLNLEGACVVGDRLRWFQRGHHRGSVPSGSVDVDVTAVVATLRGDGDGGSITVSDPRTYDLGAVGGVTLAVTDSAVLPDGRIVVSASAEDTADAVADGPVVGSALAVIEGTTVVGVAPIAATGEAVKLEGIAVVTAGDGAVTLLGVVDQDDPERPSLALDLELTWR